MGKTKYTPNEAPMPPALVKYIKRNILFPLVYITLMITMWLVHDIIAALVACILMVGLLCYYALLIPKRWRSGRIVELKSICVDRTTSLLQFRAVDNPSKVLELSDKGKIKGMIFENHVYYIYYDQAGVYPALLACSELLETGEWDYI